MSFLSSEEWQTPALNRILVPLQGFPAEVNTINLGFYLAEIANANVAILHCKERFARAKESMLEQLNAHAKNLSGSLNVPFDTKRVKSVRASDAILKTAKKEDCDLIILSASHKPTQKHVLGSTARRVTRKSKLPVIIMASWPEIFPEHPELAIRKILLPIRKIQKDITAFRLAAALKQSSGGKNAEIVALNVSHLPMVTSLSSVPSDATKHERELFLDDVEIFQEETELEVTPKHVAAKEIGDAAVEIALKEKADLIILGAQRKPKRFGGILGSVSLQIARNSHAPVAITFLP